LTLHCSCPFRLSRFN